jgi:hypothetical protein
MSQVFTPCAGGVVARPIPAGESSCAGWAAIQINDSALNTVLVNVPLTGFSLELSTNHQFLHSLNDLIYVFAFGDRVGELTLTGVSFVGECEAAQKGKALKILNYYLQKRLSKTLKPAFIKLNGEDASTQMLGFLTGVRTEMMNPELPIVQWILRYSVVLDTSTGAGGSGPRGAAGQNVGVRGGGA